MTHTPYRPIQPGIPTSHSRDIYYEEVSPRTLDDSVVHTVWTLQTRRPLSRSFEYFVLPDGCIDIVFDLSIPPKALGALIMTPHTVAISLPLGKSFRYAGIRLYPGAWQLSPVEIVGDMKIAQSLGGIDLVTIQKGLASTTRTDQLWDGLESCCQRLQRANVIQKNPTVAALLSSDISSATAMAAQTGYSIRHIQRVLRRNVGFTPHDFIKVIRFQRALYTKDTSMYADQSHYIREFKRMTGMTPQAFYRAYTNMA